MVVRVAVSVLLAAVLAGASARSIPKHTVGYDGDIVVRCHRDAPGVLQFLQDDYVDVWQFRSDGMVDVRVSKSHFDTLVPTPQCTLLIENVGEYVRRMEIATISSPDAGWFEKYHPYEEIVEWYSNLATNNPTLVKFTESIGKSYEGRKMPAVSITGGSGSKKIIYSQCLIHAREWISGATCMYIANQLVEKYGNDDTVKNLLKEVEFRFVPVVNPDGYNYTWRGSNTRLWRKNRRPILGGDCDGVDLNRNYDDHWNQDASSDPCTITYHGGSAASEPETQNTANYFKSSGDIVGAIDWHSYSQLILRPYGWTLANSPDEANLKALGDKMKKAIYSVHKAEYKSIKAYEIYHKASTGTALDWFYSEKANKNNKYRAAGYTIELRDRGTYGFLLPANQIIPTGEENFQAFLLFAKELSSNPLSKPKNL